MIVRLGKTSHHDHPSLLPYLLVYYQLSSKSGLLVLVSGDGQIDPNPDEIQTKFILPHGSSSHHSPSRVFFNDIWSFNPYYVKRDALPLDHDDLFKSGHFFKNLRGEKNGLAGLACLG